MFLLGNSYRDSALFSHLCCVAREIQSPVRITHQAVALNFNPSKLLNLHNHLTLKMKSTVHKFYAVITLLSNFHIKSCKDILVKILFTWDHFRILCFALLLFTICEWWAKEQFSRQISHCKKKFQGQYQQIFWKIAGNEMNRIDEISIYKVLLFFLC